MFLKIAIRIEECTRVNEITRVDERVNEDTYLPLLAIVVKNKSK